MMYFANTYDIKAPHKFKVLCAKCVDRVPENRYMIVFPWHFFILFFGVCMCVVGERETERDRERQREKGGGGHIYYTS